MGGSSSFGGSLESYVSMGGETLGKVVRVGFQYLEEADRGFCWALFSHYSWERCSCMYHLLLYWYIRCNLGILVLENIPVGYGINVFISSEFFFLTKNFWEILGKCFFLL